MIDPSIILGIRPVQVQQSDPLESYGKVLGLQNAMTQGNLQNLQLKEAEQGAAANERLRALFAGGGEVTPQQVMGIDPKTGMAYQRSLLENKKFQSEIDKNTTATAKSKFDMDMDRLSRGAALLDSVKDQSSWDAVKRIGAMQGIFSPEALQHFPEQYDPSTVQSLQQSGLTRAQQLEQQYKQATLGETTRHNKSTERQKAVNDPFAVGPNGESVANANVQQFQLQKANAGATRVQNNVNAYTPASEEAQKDFMKGLRTRFDQLQSAPTVLSNIESAKALVPQARGFMGSGAEPKLAAAKFLNNNLGMGINTEGVKSAEELRSRLFMGVMENLKKMDSQPSQSQQAALQKALGEIGTDPSALPKVLDVFGNIVKQKVAIHNTEAQDSMRLGVKFPYNPIINLDQQQTPGTPAPAAAQSFNSMPDPAKFPEGSTVTDTATGVKYKAQGGRWLRQ